MSATWRQLAVSTALIAALLAAAAVVLSVLGGFVLLPQLGALGWVGIGVLLFVAVQLVLFRLLGLRSRADEKSSDGVDEDQAPDVEHQGEERTGDDWRAWRG